LFLKKKEPVEENLALDCISLSLLKFSITSEVKAFLDNVLVVFGSTCLDSSINKKQISDKILNYKTCKMFRIFNI
jgi:hypothetical protein